ncbi:MAG: hypothetical protein AAB821_02160 [Patescibacteria group bacterium]
MSEGLGNEDLIEDSSEAKTLKPEALARIEERGFFVGLESFTDIYRVIEDKGGIKTSNGWQEASIVQDLVRLYELTGEGENTLSNRDGLRDAVKRLRESEINTIRKSFHPVTRNK